VLPCARCGARRKIERERLSWRAQRRGGSRTFIPILKRRNYGRPAGEALEVVWSGQKYVDPHPAEHYRSLLQVPMSTAPLNGNGSQASGAGTDLPW
jgi:hypothetical protein